ncbi:MAG: hypothetical protein HYV63_01090 [Candidatus Schekmanbacteria bacterium]|nr:hypothetical protein [Candidatus Schekmanbacteria bacterium]
MALNPVAFTASVVDDFLRYQLTTYTLADVDLYAQMQGLLSLDVSRDTPLRAGPFISLSKPFKQGDAIESLVTEGIFHPHMETLVPYPNLRAHQARAIRAIHQGKHALVARVPAQPRPRPSSTRSSAAAWRRGTSLPFPASQRCSSTR